MTESERLAAAVLVLEAELEDGDTSASGKAQCARTMMELLERIRLLGAADLRTDGLDQLAEKRAARVANS